MNASNFNLNWGLFQSSVEVVDVGEFLMRFIGSFESYIQPLEMNMMRPLAIHSSHFVTLYLVAQKKWNFSFWPPFSSLRCSVTPHLLLRQPRYQRVRAGSPIPFVYSFRAGMICCCKQHIRDSQMTTLWKAGNEGSRWTSHVFVGFFGAKRIVRSGEGNLVSLCTAFCFKYWLLGGRMVPIWSEVWMSLSFQQSNRKKPNRNSKGLGKNFPSPNLWIRVWHQKCLSNQYQVSDDFVFLIFSI